MPSPDDLHKKEISSFQFDPEPADTSTDKTQLKKLRTLCRGKLTSLLSVRKLKGTLRAFIKTYKPSARIKNAVDDIREELDEIEDDLRHAASSRGKLVIASQKQIQTLSAFIRPQKKFAGVYVGVHAKQKALMITGKVASNKALQELAKIVASHAPNAQISWNVNVSK